MDKTLLTTDYVANRCEAALLENQKYMKKEHSGTDQDELQAMAEELCQEQGFNDAMQLMLKDVNV